MMNNLFSVFDPTTGSLSMNWLSSLILIILMPYKMWFMKNKIMIMFNLMIDSLKKEMFMLMPYKGMTLLMISLFMLILINNLMGLVPYVFTSSAHLVFSLTIALPMWMGFMLFGWINKTKMMFNHLVPVGTPYILMPFMVIIETISNLIRPGSLAVRLTANMIAGHLLMSLLGNNTTSSLVLISTLMIFLFLMLFELAVAMIQSYVFMTLTTLYSSEI
uniref:ATP synthase F0 subunit 6 n=1 Tax=Limassolla lingchuanensis TaxID=2704520 RepID=UPI0013E91F99|nr:ATP synthase F0 subunit 6 [Limassolla lingchuanensis]QHR79702.1 ATP synthase F0 subunit 6 [Limassolla lingchuanensis]